MIGRSIFSQGSFERMARGVWLRVLPKEDTVDDICSAMHQDWEELLPLLIVHGLLACDVSDDVKNYTFKKNAWERFQTMHRQIFDMRRTPVRRTCVPNKVLYICLGESEYDNPLNHEKAIREKMFAYHEFDPTFPKDTSLDLQLLSADAIEIGLSKCKSSTSGSKNVKRQR
jgi:hypothetical protein